MHPHKRYLILRCRNGYTLSELEHEPQQAKLKSFFAEDNERYTFYFDLDPQELPLKVDAYMRASTPMEEALLLAIDALNLQLIPTRGLALRRESSLYKPRLAGKNFKPKSDLPGYYRLT